MERIKFIHIAAVYSIVYFSVLPFYRYQINPDCVSYIAVAEKYAEGNFAQAVNIYWSPLISFFLIPFLLLKINALLAFKIINLGASLLLLFLFQKLSGILKVNRNYYIAGSLVLFPLLLWKSFSINTPDLLSAGTLLFFLFSILKSGSGKRDYVQIGLAGVLAYLAKYYNLYFILLFLLIWPVVHSKGIKRTGIIICLTIVTCFSLLWMLICFSKYKVFSTGSSPAYNFSIIAPGNGEKYPGEKGGNNDYLDYTTFRYTSWEEPFLYEVKYWNPFEGRTDFNYYLREVIFKNCFDFFRSYWIYAAALFLFLLPGRVFFRNRDFVLILLFSFLYPLAYFFSIYENRYVIASEVSWIILLLCLFCVHEQKLLPKAGAAIALFYTAASYTIQIITHSNTGKPVFEMSGEVKGKISPEWSVYSSPGCWGEGVYVCYHNRLKFYDAVAPEKFIQSEEKNSIFICRKKEFDSMPELRRSTVVYLDNDFCVLKSD